MEGVEAPQLLVGGDSTPYGFELSEAQKGQLAEADLVIWVGPELESFLVEPLKQNIAERQIIELLDMPALKILPSRWSDDRRDPFFWLDSRNAIILLDELTRILILEDPGRSHIYLRNREKVLARLARIDRVFEYGYRGMKAGVALLYYDTLQYFAQAYALNVGMALTESPKMPVDALHLLKARGGLKNGEFACLLTESGMPAGDLPLLTEGISSHRAELDSFGTRFEAGSELYIKLMEHNTRVIGDCISAAVSEGKVANDDAVEVKNSTPEQIRGRFMLVDQYGQLVTADDLLGKFQLIYFGYTFCPDICPTSLSVISQALDRLGKRADLIQPYFITIDPERDKVDVIRNYVKYFNERIIGLTGTKAMIERVAKQYRVRYEKVLEQGSDPELYLMDHTASVYLIAPDGTFITKFAYGIDAGQMVEKLLEYLP
jgi:protein SCO1/2